MKAASRPSEVCVPVELSLDAVVVAGRDQVSTVMNGETVLLHLETGKYYGLNRVGSCVWEQLGSPTAVSTIVETLLSRFDVEPTRCESDVRRVLLDLANAGFIEIRA